MDRLYLVVPCYNEEEVLPETVRRLTDKLRRMEEKGLVSGDSRICWWMTAAGTALGS